MTQVALSEVIEQISSEIEVDATGRGKATIRATARLVDVSHSSLLKAFESGHQNPSALAQKLIEHGFEGGLLTLFSTDGIPDIAIAVILEYYAFDAGRYCTKQAQLAYKAFAAIGIRSWMQQIKGWEQPVPQTQCQIPSLEEISTLLDLTLGKAGLEPRLVAGAKLNAMGKRYPHLLKEAEDAKPILAIPVEDRLLAPKQLGEILTEQIGGTWSSQRVNKLLIEQGFQIRNPEGNPDYLSTEKGKPYSQLTLGTVKGRDKTIQHLRWFKTVLEVVEIPVP